MAVKTEMSFDQTIYDPTIDLVDDMRLNFQYNEHITGKEYKKTIHATRKFLDSGVRNNIGKPVRLVFWEHYATKEGEQKSETWKETHLTGTLQGMDFQGVKINVGAFEQLSSDDTYHRCRRKYPEGTLIHAFPYFYERVDYKSDNDRSGTVMHIVHLEGPGKKDLIEPLHKGT